EPDMPRPFLMRGNVWIRGRLIPLTSALGAVLSFVAWVIALGTHAGARVVGPLWILAGLIIYAIVRVRAGLPLLERVEEAAAPPTSPGWRAACRSSSSGGLSTSFCARRPAG